MRDDTSAGSSDTQPLPHEVAPLELHLDTVSPVPTRGAFVEASPPGEESNGEPACKRLESKEETTPNKRAQDLPSSEDCATGHQMSTPSESVKSEDAPGGLDVDVWVERPTQDCQELESQKDEDGGESEVPEDAAVVTDGTSSRTGREGSLKLSEGEAFVVLEDMFGGLITLETLQQVFLGSGSDLEQVKKV